MRVNYNRYYRLCLLVLMVLAGAFWAGVTCAETYQLSCVSYQMNNTDDYEYDNYTAVQTLVYGKHSMGYLNLEQADLKSVYKGYDAYGASKDVVLSYTYNGFYSHNIPEQWHIDNDNAGMVHGIGLGFLNHVSRGCITLEVSIDGEEWFEDMEAIRDYFSGARNGSDSEICVIPEEYIQGGLFVRVQVAYRMTRRTKENFFVIPDEYEYRRCMEVYTFYLCSEVDQVTIIDLSTGEELNKQDETNAGFQIRKNWTDYSVSVEREGITTECPDFAVFSEPGTYNISVRSTLGTEKNRYTISVIEGIDFTELNFPVVYMSNKDRGFPTEGSDAKLVSSTNFGGFLSAVSLATSKGAEINSRPVQQKYGIKGKDVSVYMKIKKNPYALSGGWQVAYDSWGSGNNQKVAGVVTGEVGYGALIVQKSADGVNWKDVDRGRYAEGLYTTDFLAYYPAGENILIYTPSGQDIIDGVYLRILLAYQIYNSGSKEFVDYVEDHEFYLCSDELDAVTFHNLTANREDDESTLIQSLGINQAEMNGGTVNVYKTAETMESGDYTTTGFSIDKSLNKSVSIRVEKNGKKIGLLNKYEDPGRYELKLTSAVGSVKEVVLYIDKSTDDESLKNYFDEGFIQGKRIYSDGLYAVFEGGKTEYYMSSVDENMKPLAGRITNLSTGTVIDIPQTNDVNKGVIEEPGDYQAVFATNKGYFDGNYSGDARVFKFRFQIIAQGTAPGPQVNQLLLKEYASSTAYDSNPVYYGLTYSSAGKGNITLAFANREDAVAYAYNYEKGIVEKQEDGTYRYNGSFLLEGQKTKYDSAWDLTDAMNYFADAAVRTEYFDMSDEFTYLTLKDDVIAETLNLRALDLPRSVTLFAVQQKELLTEIEALPLINDKIVAYQDLNTGEVIREVYDYEFITDSCGGIDSKNVTIFDSEGVSHNIQYGESVYQQLLMDNCPSGAVTIHEETMYGDSTEYQAMYIAPDDNQTEVTILCKTNGKSNNMTYKKGTVNGINNAVDSFSISEVVDPLDPYILIIVKHNQNEDFFTARDDIDRIWTEAGTYTISCRNRMGYGYNFEINVSGSEEKVKEPLTDTEMREGTEASGIMWILAIGGGIMLIMAILFIYRRIRLFSKVSKNVIKEEEN